MWPNLGPLALESNTLPIELRGPAKKKDHYRYLISKNISLKNIVFNIMIKYKQYNIARNNSMQYLKGIQKEV